MAALTNERMETGAERVHRAVDVAAARAIDRAAPTIDRVAQVAHRTVDKVAQTTGPAADWIAQSTGQLRLRQAQLLDSCRAEVRERPLVALGFAVAAGYLIARLVR